MQLAVSPTSPGMTAGDLADLCAAAEAWGYREAWLAEVNGPETFALAAAIAGRTRAMDLGVAAVPAVTRTPALLAMGSASLAELLGGRRFHLGIGASSELIVRTWHGRDFEPPYALVKETVEATRAALGGQREYSGRHVRMSRFSLGVDPGEAVDIYVAALGEGMLRLAGRIGDGVCLNLMPPEVVPRQRTAVAEGAGSAGRSAADVRVMARLHIAVDEDHAAARELVRSIFAPYFAQDVYNRFLAWCGFPEEAAEIAAGFADGDRPRVRRAMHDRVVDAVALTGTVDAVRGRLTEYARAGVDVAALSIVTPNVAEVLEALALWEEE